MRSVPVDPVVGRAEKHRHSKYFETEM